MVAEVVYLLPPHSSHENNVMLLPLETAIFSMKSRSTNKNTKIGKQSRRLAFYVHKIAQSPYFFDIRIFHFSKWLLRHFSHRKEFRRKGTQPTMAYKLRCDSRLRVT
ncbi:unnamed protein product [Xylocopa violacea]|uniref:Uncharacterized protein n=1 Tax=Xylocopa violacea TaxID=135666 RepID=A0ABP1P901_XYLVO